MFNFGIIAENLEVFENDTFDWKILWIVGLVSVKGFLLVSSFYDVCTAVTQSISRARCLPVVSAESG